MKKTFPILALVFFFSLLFPQTILATSGCCSGKHNGVNCSAGPQSNGHVVCNDGWRGSSCLYSNASECGGYAVPAVSAKPVATKAPIATPKSSPTVAPTATPTVIPTSTPPATIEPSPTPQAASTSNGSVLGELVGVGITGFLGWKGLKWLGRKAANG